MFERAARIKAMKAARAERAAVHAEKAAANVVAIAAISPTARVVRLTIRTGVGEAAKQRRAFVTIEAHGYQYSGVGYGDDADDAIAAAIDDINERWGDGVETPPDDVPF